MANKTGIEWSDYTWNPIRGCSRVTDGCRNCYAEDQAARIVKQDRERGVPEGEGAYDGLLARGGLWNGQIKIVPELLDQPIRWTKPRKIFVNSMSDLFHENVSEETIQRIFAVMASSPQHQFQILTKRAKRMRDLLKGKDLRWVVNAQMALTNEGVIPPGNHNISWPLSNVWLGVSVEDQATANERVPYLLDTPAAVRWLSMEPLLGPASLCDLENHTHLADGQPLVQALSGLVSDGESDITEIAGIDWVVVGGESGPEARPMHPHWATNLRDECASAGVPFLFKQWGEWAPRSNCIHVLTSGLSGSDMDPQCHLWPVIRLTYSGGNGRELSEVCDQGEDIYMQRVGRELAGRELYGALYDGYPSIE